MFKHGTPSRVIGVLFMQLYGAAKQDYTAGDEIRAAYYNVTV